MKFSKGKLAVAFGAALGVGMVGQASADVYGLSYLDIDNLAILTNAIIPGAGLYTFDTSQGARLNGNADPVDGFADCFGIFPATGNCSVGSPTLSGVVQNAPPNAPATSRGEGDYTVFGQNGNYSNAEAEILEATLTGDLKTHVTSISESNLASTGSAQAITESGSTTNLSLTFLGGSGGTLSVSFDATIDLQTEASGLSGGEMGVARASSGATFVLERGGVTLASWAPTGGGSITTCAAGLTCTAVETGPSLNNTSASSGANNSVIGSGTYTLDITGLTDSGSIDYVLAFSTTSSTNLARVPVPSTVLLMGTALLLGARATRRNKK